MERKDFQKLSRLRMKEARALLGLGLPEGAYYLAGYAVECALKSCIAKETRRHEFPDKKRVNACHTHDLKELIKWARLEDRRKDAAQADLRFEENWETVLEWSAESRYETHSQKDAAQLVAAIGNREHGVINWLIRYW